MWKAIKKAWGLYRHGAALKGLLETLGVYKWLALGGSAAISAVVAFYTNLPLWLQVLAFLGILILILFALGFTVALVRVWRAEAFSRRASSDSRIVVGKAIFRCDQMTEYFRDVTDEVQRLVDAKQPIYAHQNGGFSDPCKDHWGVVAEGHDKSLFIDFGYQGRLMLPYSHRRSLKVNVQWKEV